jgi:5-methylcytosine-specific restriction enzyme A
MPRKLPTPCAQPGCAALTTDPYCEQHRKEEHINKAKRTKEKKSKEELAVARERKRFYDSADWKRLRLWILQRNPLCVECSRPAREVDHIIPIADGGKRLDPNNLQAMCKSCHSSKTMGELRKNMPG